MSRIKQVVILLLLIAITVCVVFIPQYLNGQNEKHLLNQTSFWSYTGRSSTKITGKQVAELYCDPEFFAKANYCITSATNDEYNFQEINKNSKALFDTVFEGHESVCNYFKNVIGDHLPYHTKESVLTVIDDSPIVLNFINVNLKTEFETIEFTYEEKTQTLLMFYYYPFSELLSNKYDELLSLENLETAVTDYYKNKLEIPAEKFFFQTEFIEDAFSKGTATEFGLTQTNAEYYKEVDETYYN